MQYNIDTDNLLIEFLPWIRVIMIIAIMHALNLRYFFLAATQTFFHAFSVLRRKLSLLISISLMFKVFQYTSTQEVTRWHPTKRNTAYQFPYYLINCIDFMSKIPNVSWYVNNDKKLQAPALSHTMKFFFYESTFGIIFTADFHCNWI